MVIISYDIENNKLRTSFSKYLKKFGFRLQFSVYQIDNCERILNIIISEIKNNYERKFCEADSVIIFRMSSSCDITKFGYSTNLDKDFIIID